MATNRYVFNTTLEGFINVFEDGGKFNNRGFTFTIPKTELEQINADREELIAWIKSKNSQRLPEGLPAWDEEGRVKYNYGEGDGTRKPKPEPIIIDSDGELVERSILKDVRKGTKVRLILQQKPYGIGTFNTSIRVIGLQIIELATGNGSVDSGEMTVEDVASIFGKVEGYKTSEPQVRKAEAVVGDGDSYDF